MILKQGLSSTCSLSRQFPNLQSIRNTSKLKYEQQLKAWKVRKNLRADDKRKLRTLLGSHPEFGNLKGETTEVVFASTGRPIVNVTRKLVRDSESTRW